MKKKIIVAACTVTLILFGIAGIFYFRNKGTFAKRETPGRPTTASRVADEREEGYLTQDITPMAGEAAPGAHAVAAPALKNEDKKRMRSEEHRVADGVVPLGKVFTPAMSGERNAGDAAARKLEYNIAVNYQVDSLKSARAFFNQWIPRYGFLLSETASGHQNGYMTLRVRVRSANLYAALNDLDSIGALTGENIQVLDHTENAVFQQMLGAREEIRARRRTLANAATGTGEKNWEATENLLAQSEDKQLQTRMEEWRINDRIGWATIQITLALPVTAVATPVEVPEFRNAFVGLLNVLLQLVYVLIYIVPLLAVGYAVYRGVIRIAPGIRRLLPKAAH